MKNEPQHEIPIEAARLHQVSTEVRLTTDERDTMRKNILSYMNQHPAIPSTTVFTRFKELLNSLQPRVILLRPVGAVFLILVLISASTATAAEQSLPGDILYPVKINVTEPARGLLALSTEAQAEWQSLLLERRMNEATELSEQGRLDKNNSVIVSRQITEQVTKTEDASKKLQREDQQTTAVTIQSSAAASLAAQAQVFARINSDNTPDENQDDTSRDALILTMRKQAEHVAAAAAKTAAKIEKRTDSDALKRTATRQQKSSEDAIDAAKSLLTKRQDELDAQAVLDAQTTLDAAINAGLEGKQLFATNEYGKAYVKFQMAESFSKQASVLMRTSKRLRSKLKNTEKHPDVTNKEILENDKNNDPTSESSKNKTGSEGGSVELQISTGANVVSLPTIENNSRANTESKPSTDTESQEPSKQDNQSETNLSPSSDNGVLRSIFDLR
ncbi:MAG: DUF5667 domain-containing protein [Patescibacteria group bacterium]|jgi:hypothetical protein